MFYGAWFYLSWSNRN